MRALEKDRTRRYSTASEFAEDVKRYLSDQPVLAHKRGAVYVARWTTFHVRQATKSIAEALNRKGFSFVEILSTCPTNWGMSPNEASDWVESDMMPYFPLVVVYCQRYIKSTGIGTVTAMMLPYSVTFIVLWTVYLLVYWALGIPLGLQSSYSY